MTCQQIPHALYKPQPLILYRSALTMKVMRSINRLVYAIIRRPQIKAPHKILNHSRHRSARLQCTSNYNKSKGAT